MAVEFQWIKDQRLARLKRSLDKGGVVSRSKKLHKISALKFGDGSSSDDPAVCCARAVDRLSVRWVGKQRQQRMNVLGFVFRCEDLEPAFSFDTLENAFRKLKRQNKIDSDVMCIAALNIVMQACPDGFIRWLQRSFAHIAFFAELSVVGSV